MSVTVNGARPRPRPRHHTIVAIVEDKPGVLMRVASLFRRRGFNIESLTVGHSESPGLSRMTLVVDGENAPVEQVEKQFYKLIDVVKVTDLTEEEVRPRLRALVDGLFERVPAGVGGRGLVELSSQDFETVMTEGARWCVAKGFGSAEDLSRTEDRGCLPGADPAAVSKRAVERGNRQLGTLGSGNHYLEVQVARREHVMDEATAATFGIDRPRMPEIEFGKYLRHAVGIGEPGEWILFGVARDRTGLLDGRGDAVGVQIGGAGRALAPAEVDGDGDAPVTRVLDGLDLAHPHIHVEATIEIQADLGLARALFHTACDHVAREFGQAIDVGLRGVGIRNGMIHWVSLR